jgi:hypothetical protein
MNTVAIVVVFAFWSNEISRDICIITPSPVVHFNLFDSQRLRYIYISRQEYKSNLSIWICDVISHISISSLCPPVI